MACLLIANLRVIGLIRYTPRFGFLLRYTTLQVACTILFLDKWNSLRENRMQNASPVGGDCQEVC